MNSWALLESERENVDTKSKPGKVAVWLRRDG